MRVASAIYLAFGFGLIASPASATCIGTDAFSTCFDNSGNSYNVQRFGNQTFMNGTNSGTGSTWSQHSTTVGNTTIHEGQTNGNEWNMTSALEICVPTLAPIAAGTPSITPVANSDVAHTKA